MTKTAEETTTKDQTPEPAKTPEKSHDWRKAGQAWGHSANDWAYLYEHYSLDAIGAIFQRLGMQEGTKLLDIACGSGLAIRLANGAGATTAGIDAAESLVEIAKDRNPETDLRVGSMFDLPWGEESFDAVMSINGIWGGCAGALDEAYRVLKPGGRIGMSFWGDGKPSDLRACFKVFAYNMPPEDLQGMKKTNNIAFPGVAEEMLTGAGFEVVERGARVSTIEWPDAELAWRAISSVGPAVPAIEHAGEAFLKTALFEAIDHCRDARGGYRIRNDHHFVIARKAS